MPVEAMNLAWCPKATPVVRPLCSEERNKRHREGRFPFPSSPTPGAHHSACDCLAFSLGLYTPEGRALAYCTTFTCRAARSAWHVHGVGTRPLLVG